MLGARDVVRMVVGQSLAPVAAGLGVTALATPMVISVLERAGITTPLSAFDEVLVFVPVLTLLAAACAAASAPALRAAHISPSVALRAD